MPKIGEIKKAREIGYKGYYKYIWAACQVCNKERWVQFIKDKPVSIRCKACSFINPERNAKLSQAQRGERHHNWKGGRAKAGQGYMKVYLSPDDFFYPMADAEDYVLEHRLVMAKHLNRCLLPWELVHHKGVHYPLGSKENKQDNSIENLELLPGRKYHLVDTVTRSLIANLQKRVTLLEAENILLKEQLNKQAINI